MSCGIASAQDIHFSQFFMSPLNLNPALTGPSNARYRLAANQRTQWRSVTTPYSTFSVSGDEMGQFNNRLGLGVMLAHDIAGDSHLNTFAFNLSGAYTCWSNPAGDSRIKAGLQAGITNRKIDYSGLAFDQQYNGYYYDPSLPTGESFLRNSRTYLNLNVGASYEKSWERRKKLTAGFAIDNLNTPQQSFYNDKQIRLDRRLVVHGSGEYPINSQWSLQPEFQLMVQGTYREWLPGVLAKYELINEPLIYRAVYFGYLGRLKDSGVITAGLYFENWQAGVSYDVNMSSLKVASQHKGGFEFALIYLFGRKNVGWVHHKYCPDFL